MILRRLFHIVILFFILCVLTGSAGCEKEYSYEGGPVQDPGLGDSIGTPGNTGTTLPSCSVCNAVVTPNEMAWNFKIGNVSLCGAVTNAVASPDGDAFTFFGPSSCSADSGLIITAYFNNQLLNTDQNNIVANQAALQYYDNLGPSDVLLSKAPNVFNLTIEYFNRQTRIATGSFSGSVVAKNGTIVKVEAGKFYIKF